MLDDIWWTILGLSTASFAIRLGGYVLALRIPHSGAWARGMEALPGCLIMALVTLMMMKGGWIEWVTGAVVFALAAKTRNIPMSMFAGIAVVAALRLLTA